VGNLASQIPIPTRLAGTGVECDDLARGRGLNDVAAEVDRSAPQRFREWGLTVYRDEDIWERLGLMPPQKYAIAP